jgi:hypothetical protein
MVKMTFSTSHLFELYKCDEIGLKRGTTIKDVYVAVLIADRAVNLAH